MTTYLCEITQERNVYLDILVILNNTNDKYYTVLICYISDELYYIYYFRNAIT